MCRAWMEVVEDYTCRTASDESDKLVACAAIAEQFHRVLRSEYLAGLWRSDTLLVHLLWKACGSRENSLKCRHARPAAYRAPSWSWTAIEGPTDHLYPRTLRLEDRYTVALAEVTKCWVALEDPELRFGRVTDGALILRGTPILCHGRLAERIYGAELDRWIITVPSFQRVRHQWQRGLWGLISDEENFGVHPTSRGDFASVTMDYYVDRMPEKIWLVPFVRTNGDSCKDTLLGIVLELAPPSNGFGSAPEKICFRRVGCFLCCDRAIGYDEDEDLAEYRLWDPLTRAVNREEFLWTEIEIV